MYSSRRLTPRRFAAAAVFAFVSLFSLAASALAQAPTITVLPTPRQVVNIGQSLTLNAAVSGATSLQWRRNGQSIVGATNASYVINGAQSYRDTGWYQLRATNGSGTTTSAVVFVNVVVNQARIVGWGQNVIGASVASSITSVSAIATGWNHGFALRGDGTVASWGNSFYAAPTGLSNVVAIVAGNGGGAALRADGTVAAWGDNFYGQATPPTGLANVVALAMGEAHILALKSDGTVVGWGRNDLGHLNIPSGLNNVVGLESRFHHTLARREDGTVVAWGYNVNGQANVPAGLTNVVAVTTGFDHSLALKADGTIIGWGANWDGRATNPSPVSGIVAISAGSSHNAFLRNDGTVVAWGSSAQGESPAPAGLEQVALIDARYWHTHAVRNTTFDVPPAIGQHPVARSVTVGMSTSFTVTATGTAPLTYQWRKNGSAISGATLATLNFSAVAAGDAGSYDVVISNSVGSVTSNPATLTVQIPAPTITSQPASVVANFGSSAFFSVSVNSAVTATYQWRKDSQPISGATSTSYSRSNIQPIDLGSYDVIVANSGGSVTSNPATLSIPTAPIISVQPANVLTSITGTASFFVILSQGNPANYQWRRNGTPIPGATQAGYLNTHVLPTDGGTYDVVVSNSAGSVVSSSATLSLRTYIANSPAGRSVGFGGTTTFTVFANGTPPLSYQWKKNGSDIAGATGSTYTLSTIAMTDVGDYTVAVSNTHGSTTSVAANLKVLPNPLGYSTRQQVPVNGVTAHFVIEGVQSKRVLLRVLGPGLAAFGVNGTLANPQLALVDAQEQALGSNDDWSTTNPSALTAAFTQVGATPLSSGSKDAALLATLAPGAYTVRITGVDGGTGVALLELFDTDVNPGSRLAYVGVRGEAGSTVGALAMTNSANKRVLIRAVGPSLQSPGTAADPQVQVLDGSVVVAANENWQTGTAFNAATTEAGAFPLTAASNDAAVLLERRIGTGVYTAQVSTVAGQGSALLEFYDLPLTGASTLAPLVVAAPGPKTAAVGDSTSFRIVALGTGTQTYQWRRNGFALAGATTALLTLNPVTAAMDGNYDVVVTTPHGTATSAAAKLTVLPVGFSAVQAPVGSGYFAGRTLTITNTLMFPGTAEGLGWQVQLPSGWSFVSDFGAGDVKPLAGATGTLDWAWTTPPSSPVTFSYTVNVPAGAVGVASLPASAIVRQTGGTVVQLSAQPEPLRVGPVTFHDADTSRDSRIGLFELTRVIELYNTRNGTTRTGAYAVNAGTEDGFAPDPARAPATTVALTRYHSADTRGVEPVSPPDGKIGLSELTRVIELFNVRTGTTRTGRYRPEAGMEDGFTPHP